MCANLRQDVEPVQVKGTLSTVRSGSGVGIFSAEKPCTRSQRLVSSLRAGDAFPCGREAEGPGTRGHPAARTALSTCPLTWPCSAMLNRVWSNDLLGSAGAVQKQGSLGQILPVWLILELEVRCCFCPHKLAVWSVKAPV